MQLLCEFAALTTCPRLDAEVTDPGMCDCASCDCTVTESFPSPDTNMVSCLGRPAAAPAEADWWPVEVEEARVEDIVEGERGAG